MGTSRPAYLNGAWKPLEGLSVPVIDHGFLYGDGVYEVIPVYHRAPRCLDGHLDRLADSIAGIGLRNTPARDEVRAILLELIERSPEDDHLVYLQVTRGTPAVDAPFRKQFPDAAPTVFAMTQPLPVPPDSCAAITRRDRRWGRCYLKTTMLLESVLATQDAVEHGAAESILYRGEKITEGATSNAFAVVDDRIRTPQLSRRILPGVTRALLLRLLREDGIEVLEGPLYLDELRRASEVWLTGSTRGVLPVVRINDLPVGAGDVGPVARAARARYRAWCEAL